MAIRKIDMNKLVLEKLIYLLVFINFESIRIPI